MFCPNCGASVTEGRKFCGKCGVALNSRIVETTPAAPSIPYVPVETAAPAPAQPTSPQRKAAYAVVALLLILGGVGWWLLHRSPSAQSATPSNIVPNADNSMESTPSITANPQQSKRLRANVNANPSIQFANPAPSRPAPLFMQETLTASLLRMPRNRWPTIPQHRCASPAERSPAWLFLSPIRSIRRSPRPHTFRGRSSCMRSSPSRAPSSNCPLSAVRRCWPTPPGTPFNAGDIGPIW